MRKHSSKQLSDEDEDELHEALELLREQVRSRHRRSDSKW